MSTRSPRRRGHPFALCAAVGMAFAVFAAPAGAAIGPITGAKLTITKGARAGTHNVAVLDGVVPATQAEAQALVNSGHRVEFRLYGDDPVRDDLRIGPYAATSFVPAAPDFQPMGLQFRKVLLNVSDRRLDEDIGGDELYVAIRLVDRAGKTVRSGRTNKVSGNF